MKLLVVSDLHGSFSRASALPGLMARHDADSLVLLGDLLYHGCDNSSADGYDSAKTAGFLNGLCDKAIAVRGNCDSEEDLNALSFALAPRFAWIFAEGMRILATHGHFGGASRLPESAELIPGDAFLSGHTHVPEARKLGGVHIWNPGSMALPRGGYPPSYGLFAEGRFSVMGFDGKCIMEDIL